MITLKAGANVVEAIRLAYRARLAVMLCGGHGVGKSEFLKQSAAEMNINCFVRDLSLMEPSDLVGLPQVVGNRTVYAAPASLPSCGRGLLALEELNRCPHFMLAPCLQLLTERRLNDYSLPKRWMVAAAINPSDGDYQVSQLDPALLSRFVQISVEPDAQQWLIWATGEGNIEPSIVDFVRDSPNIFDDPVSNPRAWTYASKMIREWERGSYSQETIAAMLEGTVGDKWAAAFWQYYIQDRAPLRPAELLANYTTSRAVVRRWLKNHELDLVSATVRLLKDFLRSDRNYYTVLTNESNKKHVLMFLSDLPGDLSRKMHQWLKDHGRDDLDMPGSPQ
jgi:MoxR-like ATPase